MAEELPEDMVEENAAAAEDDAFTFMESDRAFHNLLCDYAENYRLMNIAENYQDLCHLMGTKALTSGGRMAEAIAEHEVIVDAVRGKDPEKAARSMHDHLEKIRMAVLESF